MLEVKHLRKQYATKKGVVTNALDDVSLTFPETGMVFILGKSGSGKSTLLNVCGGLDKYTSGEIVIKGKSSAQFTSSDFDSYRNTYVGFVFQEYNILEDFTVEDNIALALELQNKKRDKAVIDKILADVDMTDFASRKPNTLSGGQKQRVAIARALVKEPQIIMADEPTGALDSKTGQQVFDTLKKLSSDKLVLVVSHDRDFAEQYADRIIELKDGKVISDMTRNEQSGEDKNVSFFGSDTVCVRNASQVTDKDIESIRKFLSKTSGSAVITTSRERVAAVKEELPEMGSGDFEEIKQQPQSKQYGEQHLIRSKFPLRHAVKMGASGLKTKPVRLAFTILLSIVAFVLFGLASTLMLFDGRSVTKQSLIDADYDYLILTKSYYQTVKYYEGDKFIDEDVRKLYTGSTLAEFEELRKTYPDAIAAIDGNTMIGNVEMDSSVQQFYTNNLDGFILANNSLKLLAGRLPEAKDEIAITDFLFDSFATKKTKFYYYSDDESDEATRLTLTSGDYNKILYSPGSPIMLNLFGGEKFKIVGVFKGSAVPSEYEELKRAADENRQFDGSNMTLWQWSMAREDAIYARIAVTDDFVNEYCGMSDRLINVYDYFRYSENPAVVDYLQKNNQYTEYARFMYMSKYKSENGDDFLQLYDLNGNKLESLAANAIGISCDDLATMYTNAFYNFRNQHDENYNSEEYERVEQEVNDAMEKWYEDNPQPNWDDYYNDENEFDESAYNVAYSAWIDARAEYMDLASCNASKMKEYRLLEREAKRLAEAEFIKANPKPSDDTSDEYYSWYARLDEYKDRYWHTKADPISRLGLIVENKPSKNDFFELIAQVRELFDKMDVQFNNLTIYNDYNDAQEIVIAGIYLEGGRDCAYLSDGLYEKFYVGYDGSDWHNVYETKYEVPEGAYITQIYVPYNKSAAIVDDMLDRVNAHNDDDSSADILNPVMDQLEMLIDMAKTLSTAFLIAGLALAAFAFLLMFNFISVSITSKKKEIGILRAIGARTADVFKIFLSEALIVALICFVIATAATWALCVLLNSVLTDGTILSVSIFVFGPLSALCILAIAALTAILSTVIPVALYSRKPPVASIRAL